MSVWIMSANSKVYDHQRAFEEQGYIDWKQTRNFQVGDVVYIYLTKPIAKVKYKTIVTDTNIKPHFDSYWSVPIDEDHLGKRFMRLALVEVCNSDALSFDNLHRNGLMYAPQSPGKIDDALAKYIESQFGGKEL